MRFTKEIIGTVLLISVLLSVFLWQHFMAPEVETLLENPRVLGFEPNSNLPPTWEELLQTIDRSGILEYNVIQTELKSLGFRSLFIDAPSSLFDDFGRYNWSSGEISLLDYETGEAVLDKARAQFRGRGNTTWGMSSTSAMRPLRFRLQGEADVTGRGDAKQYILMAAGNERGHFCNWIALNLAARLSGLNFVPSTELINVYFNNQFVGVYLLTDERDLQPHRSTITPHDIPAKSEFLLEQDGRASGVEYIDYVIAGGRYNMRHPSGTGNVTVAHGWLVRDLMLEFQQVLDEAVANNDFELFASYVDIDSFIDFYLLNYALDVKDYGGLSIWFEIRFSEGGQLGSRSRFGAGRRIYMGPVWDFDVMAVTNPKDFDTIEIPAHWLNSALKIDEFSKMFNQRAGILSRILPEVKELTESVLEYNSFNLERSYEMNRQAIQRHNSRNVTGLQEDLNTIFEWLDTRFTWIQNNPAQPRKDPDYLDVTFRGEIVKVEALRGYTDVVPVTSLASVPFNGIVEWLEDRLVIMEFGNFALKFETGSPAAVIQAGRFDTESIILSKPVQVISGRNVITIADFQRVLNLIETTLGD